MTRRSRFKTARNAAKSKNICIGYFRKLYPQYLATVNQDSEMNVYRRKKKPWPCYELFWEQKKPGYQKPGFHLSSVRALRSSHSEQY